MIYKCSWVQDSALLNIGVYEVTDLTESSEFSLEFMKKINMDVLGWCWWDQLLVSLYVLLNWSMLKRGTHTRETDRREWAHAASDCMKGIQLRVRAHFSFCQLLTFLPLCVFPLLFMFSHVISVIFFLPSFLPLFFC